MSLFVAGLAFSDPEVFRSARLSVVVGSLLSAAGGVAVLRFASRKRLSAAPNEMQQAILKMKASKEA